MVMENNAAHTTGVAQPVRLTPTERQILSFLELHNGRSCTKAQIAVSLGRNKKTIDRLMSHLRAIGLVSSEPAWGEDGGQLANSYRLMCLRSSAAPVGVHEPAIR